MGRLSASLITLALATAAALGLLGCGEGGDAELLPGETASQINSNIDQVERLVAEGDCVGAEDASAAVTGQVESLDGVDATLKRALSDGATRLGEVVAECNEEAEEATEELEPPEEEIEAEERAREEGDKNEGPAKEKPEKEAPEEAGEEGEGPTLPPQSNGKGEEKGKGGAPPPEPPEPPSGGVGPGVEAGEG